MSTLKRTIRSTASEHSDARQDRATLSLVVGDDAKLYCPPVLEDSKDSGHPFTASGIPAKTRHPSPFYRDPNRARELGDGGRREAWAGGRGGIESDDDLRVFQPSLPLQNLIVKHGGQRTYCQAMRGRTPTRRSVFESRPRVFMRAAGLTPATTTEPSVELHTRCEDLPPPSLRQTRLHGSHPRLVPLPQPASSAPFHDPHRLGPPRIHDTAVLIHENEELPLRSPDARRGKWRCQELSYGLTGNSSSGYSRTEWAADGGSQSRMAIWASLSRWDLPGVYGRAFSCPLGRPVVLGGSWLLDRYNGVNSGLDRSPSPMDDATLLLPCTPSQSIAWLPRRHLLPFPVYDGSSREYTDVHPHSVSGLLLFWAGDGGRNGKYVESLSLSRDSSSQSVIMDIRPSRYLPTFPIDRGAPSVVISDIPSTWLFSPTSIYIGGTSRSHMALSYLFAGRHHHCIHLPRRLLTSGSMVGLRAYRQCPVVGRTSIGRGKTLAEVQAPTSTSEHASVAMSQAPARDVIPASVSPVSPLPLHPSIDVIAIKAHRSAYRPSSLSSHPPTNITTNTTIMLYSARAIIPPNGFVPHGARRVAQPAPSSSSPSLSPNPARRRSSVVELLADILPVLRTTKAEPLRWQRAQQGSPSTDACSPHVAQMKALGGVPLCRQRAHRGISSGSESSSRYDSAVQEESTGIDLTILDISTLEHFSTVDLSTSTEDISTPTKDISILMDISTEDISTLMDISTEDISTTSEDISIPMDISSVEKSTLWASPLWISPCMDISTTDISTWVDISTIDVCG
ncbi:hypothetical protein C8F01DRAFT_1294127 [Mycena amicta]|nr:hypothetical protein C8F01DRAFT_1294127 [Mycena amicta]